MAWLSLVQSASKECAGSSPLGRGTGKWKRGEAGGTWRGHSRKIQGPRPEQDGLWKDSTRAGAVLRMLGRSVASVASSHSGPTRYDYQKEPRGQQGSSLAARPPREDHSSNVSMCRL